MSETFKAQCAAIHQFTVSGVRNECPFCLARTNFNNDRGTKLYFIGGTLIGQYAKICGPGWGDGDIMVSQQDDCGFPQFNINRRRDPFLNVPVPIFPSWLCMLSARDIGALEDSCIQCILRVFDGSARDFLWKEAARSLAASSWRLRLPVTGLDIWPHLAAHGFLQEWMQGFCSYYDFGFSLLVSTHARRPIKKKRVYPMRV